MVRSGNVAGALPSWTRRRRAPSGSPTTVPDLSAMAAATSGHEIRRTISSLDTVDRRLFLTMKNIGMERPAPVRQQQQKRKDDDDKPVAGTIGDLIKEKFGAKLDLK